MAKDNANGIRSSPPLVSRTGRVRLHSKAPPHLPGKSQTHVDEFSRLPVDPPPPEDTLLQV